MDSPSPSSTKTLGPPRRWEVSISGTRWWPAWSGNSEITSRLAVTVGSLSAADAQMDKGATFATVVIPTDFTQSVLSSPRATMRHPFLP